MTTIEIIFLVIMLFVTGIWLIIKFFQGACYRRPEEEARDRDNEAKYWRERAKEKRDKQIQRNKNRD